MSFDIDTCQFAVWGFKHGPYNTFRHIHEAFYRALLHKFPNRTVLWADDSAMIEAKSDLWANTFFISMNYGLNGIPVRDDCFYAVHNVEEEAQTLLAGKTLLNYGVYISDMQLGPYVTELAKDTFQSENKSTVVFRWGTDLLPHEIEANKPDRVFNNGSKVINYVGTNVAEYKININPFAEAAWKSGILFRSIGGFTPGTAPVSIQENVRLVKQSYMAPAILTPWQVGAKFIPCRVFKNISYGQFPVTNSLEVKNFLGGSAIQDSNPYYLFGEAKMALKWVPLRELHGLMDEVAEHHTYLNKVDALLKAARNLLA